MKTLQHSPEKYPMLENYSGFEVVQDGIEINGKVYPHTEPIYATEDGETWYIQTPLFLNQEEIVVVQLRAPSANSLVAALNCIQAPGVQIENN